MYRPLRMTPVDLNAGVFTVHNYLDFHQANELLILRYELRQNGRVIASGKVEPAQLAIAPHGDGQLRIPMPKGLRQPFAVYFETLQKCSSPLVEPGAVLGCEQHGLAVLPVALPAETQADIAVSESVRYVDLTGPAFSCRYNKISGAFDQLTVNGTPMLLKPMHLNLWHAPTDNERKLKQVWHAYGYDGQLIRTYGTRISRQSDRVLLTTDLSVGPLAYKKVLEGTVCWTVHANGRLDAAFTMHKLSEQPALPRFGVRLFLPRQLTDVTYFGMGPWESYLDKQQASVKHLYRSTVDDLYVEYLRPQEGGSHCDCDYLALSGGAYTAAVTGSGFSFNASRYTQEELERKGHADELVPEQATVLCIDYAHNGIGSASCGPELDRKYRLTGDFCFGFSLFLGGEQGCGVSIG